MFFFKKDKDEDKEEEKECFICCTIDGKSNAEQQFEMMYNQKTMNYPLISLNKAYDCNCRNLHAHNKCLLSINKCPTCRKTVLKPNLYVKTKYDYYLWFLLDWIKKDNLRIDKIKWSAVIGQITLCVFLYIAGRNKEALDAIIPPKSHIALCFAIVIGCLHFVFVYTFVVLGDYFNKYCLYDSKTKICRAF
jgi:hypothetical protein